MKVLAASEIVSIESDDENAKEAHAKVLLDIFSRYTLDELQPGEVTVCRLETDLGPVEYHCHQKVLS